MLGARRSRDKARSRTPSSPQAHRHPRERRRPRGPHPTQRRVSRYEPRARSVSRRPPRRRSNSEPSVSVARVIGHPPSSWLQGLAPPTSRRSHPRGEAHARSPPSMGCFPLGVPSRVHEARVVAEAASSAGSLVDHIPLRFAATCVCTQASAPVREDGAAFTGRCATRRRRSLSGAEVASPRVETTREGATPWGF